MLVLVSAGRFTPRRRPQPAREEMPLRPLLEVLRFWTLLVMGGLFVTTDAMQFYAALAFGVTLDAFEIVVMAVMGASAPVCFWIALVFWFLAVQQARADSGRIRANRCNTPVCPNTL